VSATKPRKWKEISLHEKIENLRNDILNAPNHILGDHSKCAKYFYNKGSDQLSGIVYDYFVNNTLFETFVQSLNRVVHLASSLLYDVDINAAEFYNSIGNKFIWGKRISYEGRCCSN
jgi:hypothetical protein